MAGHSPAGAPTRRPGPPPRTRELAALLGLAAVLAGFVVWRAGTADDEPGAPAAPAAAGLPEGGAGAEQAVVSMLASASLEPEQAGGARAEAPLAASGRVVDLAGHPVAYARIGRRPAPGALGVALATSLADGTFHLATDPSRDPGEQFVGLDPEWETVRPALASARGRLTIVLARPASIGGRVVLADGTPVVDALLVLDCSVPPVVDEATAQRRWVAMSGTDGAFTFPRAPVGPAVELMTTRFGMRTDRRRLLEPAAELLIQLEAEGDATPRRGLVLGPTGEPVAGAVARLGSASATSDAAGEFELPAWAGAVDQEELYLVVTATGHAPSRTAVASEWAGNQPLVVRLEPPRSIRGRVFDAAGRPAADWQVALGDPTAVDPTFPAAGQVEQQVGGDRVNTDADGRFELVGLLARPYSLEAWDLAGKATARCREVEPGPREIELRAGASGECTVQGVVLDPTGRPIAGALVGEERPGFGVPNGPEGLRSDGRTNTDRLGRFNLRVRGAALHLMVLAAGYGAARLAIDPARGAVPPCTVRLTRSRVVRITSNGAADGLEIVFGAAADGGSVMPPGAVGTGDGQPATASTAMLPATATTLVVSRYGRRSLRLPIRAAAAELDLVWNGFGAPLPGRPEPSLPPPVLGTDVTR